MMIIRLELECFLSLMFALTVLYCRSIEDCICQCFGQNFSLKKKKKKNSNRPADVKTWESVDVSATNY